MEKALQAATFGGGCFWCLEAAFGELAGVERVVSGYSGGQVADPSYEEVCRGDTGHAEVVRIEFDAETISYRDLLDGFFAIHDPTTKDRQGNDVGTQYRSVIFFHTPEQQLEAQAAIAALTRDGVWDRPIVTELLPALAFYPAEDYHRDYFRLHARQPYCTAVVAPKVAKLRAKFATRLKRG